VAVTGWPPALFVRQEPPPLRLGVMRAISVAAPLLLVWTAVATGAGCSNVAPLGAGPDLPPDAAPIDGGAIPDAALAVDVAAEIDLGPAPLDLRPDRGTGDRPADLARDSAEPSGDSAPDAPADPAVDVAKHPDASDGSAPIDAGPDGCGDTCAPKTTSVTCGHAVSCAISDSGHVRCWNVQRADTVADLPLRGSARQVVIGNRHFCALLSTGAVRCWGMADKGQLGAGNTTTQTADSGPGVDIGGTVVQLASSWEHTCALLAEGTIRCWGSGARGQLGYGNTQNVGDDETPARLAYPDVDVGGRAIQVVVGFSHTCALLENRKVRCWGAAPWNAHAQDIGDDETPASIPDADVPLDGPAVQLAGGEFHTCALLADGRVRCWGIVQSSGFAPNFPGPSQVQAPIDLGGGPVLKLAAGGESTCAVLLGGAVRCWGYSPTALGYPAVQAGTPPNGGSYPTAQYVSAPAQLAAPDLQLGGRAVDVSVGQAHQCALMETGAIRCWGSQYGSGYGRTDIIGDDEPPGSGGDVPLW
jgi:alpha-tubulin suppressor-like RCC1 family protein